jgi:gas vesicle protein
MTAEGALQVALAAAVLIAGAALAAAALDVASRAALAAVGGLLGGLTVAGWVVYAFTLDADVAAAATGITACLLAALGAFGLRHGRQYGRRVEEDISAAEARLRTLIDREATERAGELERTLARARADSTSLLAHEERRIADERRKVISEAESAAATQLAETLATVQQRVEQRLAGWAEDLDRAQQHLVSQLERLAQRQALLIAEAESRIEQDSRSLETTTDEQRHVVARLREELGRIAQEATAAAQGELESHAAERRRALHEVAERLRRREREMQEQIEREEAEAVRRIASGFEDVERRQIERIQRTIERDSARYVEAAELQFAETMKSAREDAAVRLSRELDRAVQAFAREAQGAIGERMGQMGDLGAQRVDKRISQIAAGLERQREELFAAFERRFAEAEANLLRRVQALERDASLADRSR